MTQEEISDEQINAFIDEELGPEEKSEILARIERDARLREKVSELRHLKDMVALSYEYPPEPLLKPVNRLPLQRLRLAVAATVFLALGMGIGLWLSDTRSGTRSRTSHFVSMQQLGEAIALSQKVLLHVSTMDRARVEVALAETERLLSRHHQDDVPLDLEIVVNSQGLGLLRDGSPYATRVRQISSEYSNVSFLACGQARENARLREGREIDLLPEAVQIPTALDRILSRIKTGWLYVKV